MATTLRRLGGDVAVFEAGFRGILHHAKSLVGSHISDTADGRYAPTELTSEELTFCDVRRIIPRNVPLCFLDAVTIPASSLGGVLATSCDSGLALLSRPGSACEFEESAEAGRCWDPPNLNMWTVSEAEDMHNNEEATLKDMLKIVDGIAPLRN